MSPCTNIPSQDYTKQTKPLMNDTRNEFAELQSSSIRFFSYGQTTETSPYSINRNKISCKVQLFLGVFCFTFNKRSPKQNILVHVKGQMLTV